MTWSHRAVVVGGVTVAIAALILVLATALVRPDRPTETGVVTAVDAASLTDVRGFTLRTTDGRTVTFRIGRLENAAEFSPGHLAEHQATSAPIVVTYVPEGEERVAVRIEDAVLASP